MTAVSTTSRVRRFKLARVVCPLSYLAVLAALKLHAPPLVVYSLAAIGALATLYLVLWRCPDCRRLYAVKPTFAYPNPHMGIVWPYFSRCLHCNHPLDARTQRRAGT